jgi:hypothetical protein
MISATLRVYDVAAIPVLSGGFSPDCTGLGSGYDRDAPA